MPTEAQQTSAAKAKKKPKPKQPKNPKGNAAYMTKVNSFNAVAHLVQRR